MTEEEVKDASCQVLSSVRTGTGWLISSEHVLTALHCVQVSSEGTFDRVIVKFGVGDVAAEVEATVIEFDAGLDVCLLQLPAPSALRPVPLATAGPRPGDRWFAFGYPVVKLQLGHVVQGVVQQVLEAPIHGIDLDLAVDPLVSLSGYEGLSGAALMVDDVCQGIVRVSVDNTLGAISSARLQEFLSKHGLNPTNTSSTVVSMEVGARPQFDEVFTDCLREGESGYVLLDGVHGIGKSTYCRTFAPDAADIDVLGVYAFSDRSRGSTPAHQAQPEIFYDWLNSLRSTRSTGRPARLTELSYPQLIQHTHQALQALAMGCARSGKRGVLFIDGVNEADKVGGEALQRFVGLLPHVLPTGLKVIITGVGLEALSAKLGDITLGAKRLNLPVLGMQAQADICVSTLQGNRATPQLIGLLCDLALGHPLYLRYLLDLVNGGASDEELKRLPAFSGAIEDFYETIWTQLLSDAAAVNLLGIIARLRWGVPTAGLMPLLTPSEATAYIPTLARIRHLLSTPEQTEIYHPSFSEFVAHKTLTSGKWVQGRLAAFCADAASGDYGVLNRVYHGLLGDRTNRTDAVRACDQSWVDRSVLLEAEPDVLLSDIDDALTAATREGTAVDIIRLLLLSQRLIFRYNTLFAQSAELVAQALISLGKTDHALRHILRYGQLIVGPDQAFAVARSLIAAQRYDEAMKILAAVDRALSAAFAADDMSWAQYVQLAKLKIHGYVLAEKVGAAPPTFDFFNHINKVVRDPRNGLSVDKQQLLLQAVIGDMLGAILCLQGKYKPIAKIPLPEGMPTCVQAMSLIAVLEHARIYSEVYRIRLPEAPIKLLLADIEEKLDNTLLADQRDFSIVDALIDVGAAPELVKRYANGVALDAGDIPLFTKSRALADDNAFATSYLRLRASYFLGEQLIQPTAQLPGPRDWEVRLGTLARAVAWYDGSARCARGMGDVANLNAVQKDLEANLFPTLEFSLESRIAWEESYFMPEHVVPMLYHRLARLYLDCFACSAGGLLDIIARGFGRQLGLYNEGFRRALIGVIEPFIEAEVQGVIADKVFDLLMTWRDYVLENVQNRYELVPELLHIVSLLVRAGAAEEALRTYQSVLSVSMGPGWYKEDQLSLMSEVLTALPVQAVVEPSALAQIAAYLERATGEMTFRRYVRSDKGTFIGELFRRSLGADGVMYFQHQACGTTQQLLDQVSEGNLDRVSPFVGMRFPGGALEEQAALLTLLKNLNDGGSWRLRWALLETYQHGDERHLTDWGRAYAAIINGLAEHSSDLAWACARVRTISYSMNRERAWLLLQALVSDLQPLALEPLAAIVNEFESYFSAKQLDRLSSNFGARRRSPDSLSQRATTQLADGTSSPHSEATPEEEVELSEPDDESVLLPGTFGRRSAGREAAQAIEMARAHLRRRSSAAAIECSLTALKALQRGEWSIWDERHSAGEADRILKDLIPDGDALARTYGSLALEERHVQRWRIAARLIQLTSAGIDSHSQTELLRVATDHVAQMMGQASSDRFSYIGHSACAEGTPAALELLLWALDHPSLERRDSATAMLLWLLRSEDTWTQPLALLMLSQDRRHRADAVAAALDILSNENPVDLWTRVAPHLNVDTLPDQIRHVGRFSVLFRIADRAGRQGVAGANALAHALEAKLQGVLTPLQGAEVLKAPAYVPTSLDRLWRNLSELGVLNTAVVQRFSTDLAAACAPLSIEEGYALELGVSNAFGERMMSLDRWALRIRHALHVAIFPGLSLEALRKADAILRIYNPESLVEPPDGQRLTSGLVDALTTGSARAYMPSDKDLVYLHMQCVVEARGTTVHIELVPQLVQLGHHGSHPVAKAAFCSTELAHPGRGGVAAVCGRVFPISAYFGSLTPAIATPEFLSFIGADADATLRYHWRDGSTVSSQAPSRGYEHSVLAVKRESLKLPPDWRLEWSLRIDGKHQVSLNRY